MAAGNGEVDTTRDGEPWYLGEYFILTVTLLLATVGYPFVSRVLGPFALKSVLTALSLAAMYATRDTRVLFRIMVGLAVPVVALNLLVEADDSYDIRDKLALISTSLFLFVALVAVFVRVIRSPSITTDVLFGAVAVYLLFGAVVAILLQFIHLVEPGGSLTGTAGAGTGPTGTYQFNDFLYFSFITLTSVGYGDYAPVGPSARSLAMFEGVFGQLYIAIMIARLVGLHASRKQQDRP